jgi:glycosyltransferase involved in cell wall biosynthesis
MIQIPSGVSVVVATRDRPGMPAAVAAQYFKQGLRQIARCELIIVDSSDTPVDIRSLAPEQLLSEITVVHTPGAPLGFALNTGFGAARSPVVIKWDDDDLYGSGFLERALQALVPTDDRPAPAVAAWNRYDVIQDNVRRRVSPATGIIAGGTITATYQCWLDVRWDSEARSGVDRSLLERVRNHPEYGPRRLSLVSDSPELYTYMRHGHNTWQTVTAAWGERMIGTPLAEIIRGLPLSPPQVRS